MKRTFYLIAILAIFIGFTSCEKDDDNSNVSSKVEITLKELTGKLVSNETIYMFTEPSTETFGNKPIYAKKSSVTNESGIASFELQEVFDLDAVSSQTTLYFTVLSKVSTTSYDVKGTIGVTVKKGESYKKTLTLSK